MALYGYIGYIAQQSVPFTATAEYLEAWAGLAGLTRKSPTMATATVVFTGTPMTAIAAGTVLNRSDGFSYTTNNLTTVATPVGITATVAGSLGNNAASTVLTMQNSLTGVDATVSTTGANTTATDSEPDAALRSRMLAAFSARPMGGTPADHVSWALAVDSVTQAWCADVPMAGNTVVVYVMLDRTNSTLGYPQGTDGAASEDVRWTTATGDQLAIAEAMYGNKPVGEIMVVASPVQSTVNFAISGLSSASSSTQAAVYNQLVALMHNSGSPLGTTITLAAMIQAIEVATGTTNFDLVSPSNTLTFAVGQLPEVGTVTYS